MVKTLCNGLAAVTFMVAPAAWAQTANTQPQVELQLTQNYSVANSELVAELSATAVKSRADQAASAVNADLRWAEGQLAAFTDIHWQLVGYSSGQQGDKDWQMQGNLSLRADPKVLLPVLATLQSRLQLRSLHSQASSAAIAAAQRQSQAQVLHRFVQEAQAACQNLGLSWGGIKDGRLRSSVPLHPLGVAPVFLAAERAVPAPIAEGHSESHAQMDLSGTAFCKN